MCGILVLLVGIKTFHNKEKATQMNKNSLLNDLKQRIDNQCPSVLDQLSIFLDGERLMVSALALNALFDTPKYIIGEKINGISYINVDLEKAHEFLEVASTKKESVSKDTKLYYTSAVKRENVAKALIEFLSSP